MKKRIALILSLCLALSLLAACGKGEAPSAAAPTKKTMVLVF